MPLRAVAPPGDLQAPMVVGLYAMVGKVNGAEPRYSTVTDFAKLRGLSTSVPRAQAVW